MKSFLPPRDTPPVSETYRTLALAPWTSKRPRALVTTEAIVERWREEVVVEVEEKKVEFEGRKGEGRKKL